MNVKIEEGCIGCSLCASTCPEVFKMNDDGIAEVISMPDATNQSKVQEAAKNCPVSVICLSYM